MRPVRRSFRPVLPGFRSAASRLAVALVAGSVIYALGRGTVGDLLLLVPPAVRYQFRLWQPLSYAFVEISPFGVIFGALILWQLGSALEQSWGSRRMTFFALGTTVVAGILTVLLTLIVPRLEDVPGFAGGTVMASAVWVAYGLSWGRQQTNFWGLPLSGNLFALIGVGFVFLNGAFNGFLFVVPSALALLLTWGYVKVGGPAEWLLRVRGWRLQRRLRARSKHLKVVSPERNTSGDSDRYLH
jgi:membrane associated rhomboid family serine protease